MEPAFVKVLLSGAKDGGTYEALSYTVFARGRLEVALAGSPVEFDLVTCLWHCGCFALPVGWASTDEPPLTIGIYWYGMSLSCPRDRDEPCTSCATVSVTEFGSGTPGAGSQLAPTTVIPEVVGLLDLLAVAVGIDRGEGEVTASLDLQYLGASGVPSTEREDRDRVERRCCHSVEVIGSVYSVAEQGVKQASTTSTPGASSDARYSGAVSSEKLFAGPPKH
jgi:hypothetical protein